MTSNKRGRRKWEDLVYNQCSLETIASCRYSGLHTFFPSVSTRWRSTVLSVRTLWTLWRTVSQNCYRKWRSTCCFTWLTTCLTLGHVPPSTQRGQRLNTHMIMCVHKWEQITPLLLCRCESFNSVMRIHNIYANQAAPCRDIAHSFAVMEHLRFICGGGTTDVAQRFGPHFLTIYFCMIVTVHWECRESWQQIISRFHIHLTQDSWTRPQGDV